MLSKYWISDSETLLTGHGPDERGIFLVDFFPAGVSKKAKVRVIFNAKLSSLRTSGEKNTAAKKQRSTSSNRPALIMLSVTPAPPLLCDDKKVQILVLYYFVRRRRLLG